MCFYLVSLCSNFESQISIILDLILVFSLFAFRNSILFLLFDFFANIDPNQVIFYYVDSSLSYLSKYIKSLIFHLNSLYDLIKF